MVVPLSRIINPSGDIVAYVTGSDSVAITFFRCYLDYPELSPIPHYDCSLEKVGYLDTDTNEFHAYRKIIKLI